MTPPRKWHIGEEGTGYVLKYDNGVPIKKPNASSSLGKIVAVADKQKYNNDYEAIVVGSVVLFYIMWFWSGSY